MADSMSEHTPTERPINIQAHCCQKSFWWHQEILPAFCPFCGTSISTTCPRCGASPCLTPSFCNTPPKTSKAAARAALKQAGQL